jgi:acetolactate synthase-1/2/3 large subunit
MPATSASASIPSWPRACARSDLIIAIGPRLGEMTTGGYTLLKRPRPAQKLVHIHASAEELNRVYQADLAINATMNAAARSLEVLTAPPEVPWEAWTRANDADYLANLVPQKLPGDIDMPAIVACCRSTCRPMRC